MKQIKYPAASSGVLLKNGKKNRDKTARIYTGHPSTWLRNQARLLKNRFLETAYKNFTKGEIKTLAELLFKMSENLKANKKRPIRRMKETDQTGYPNLGFKEEGRQEKKLKEKR